MTKEAWNQSAALAECLNHPEVVLARSADSHVDSAVRRLYLDAATAEVVEALRRHGLRAVLLKGPAIARWLYPDGGRDYGDIDLLVPPSQFAEAESVLADLGYSHALGEARPGEPMPFEHEWRRGPPRTAEVDLHRSLCWAGGDYDTVWETLTERTELLAVAGAEVEVLAPPARALLVAAHAAQHGRGTRAPLDDLGRALARTDPATWEQAAQLAERIGAVDYLAAGLRLLPAGAEVADDLGLPTTISAEAQLRAEGAPPIARGLLRLSEAPTLRARLALLAGELVPSPAFMRGWQPLARRGLPGLVAAYLWRPFWLASKVPEGVIPWLRARSRQGP